MGKLGVIGGLGSKASAYFYNLIVDHTVAYTDQDHIDAIYINHASIPDRTDAILSQNTDNIRNLLIEDARLLEQLGVTHIAIPCNTSHFFWRDIQNSVNIPVINMIEEAVKYAKNSNIESVKKIGILATDGTVKTGIYENVCKENMIDPVYPSIVNQRKVMDAIYQGIKKGVNVNVDQLSDVLEELFQNSCSKIILGCTELSVIFKDHHDERVIDAMWILAKRSIELSGKQVKE